MIASEDETVTSANYEVYDDDALNTILQWRIEECNVTIQNYQPTEELQCPPTYDNYGTCWNATPAGSIAFAPCPFFITGMDPRRMAHRLCTEDGTWFRHPESNKVWSNFTTCLNEEDFWMRQIVIKITIAGYSISLIALVISLIIFCWFQSLKCTRIQIHRNLFVSFIMNNSMWIIWYKVVLERSDVLQGNWLSCRVLHVLKNYFLVSNYFWMFCEGLYLHTLLVVTFVAEDALMKWFYLIGWVIPAMFTIIYAAVRGSNPKETSYCWMDETKSTWILSGPVCLSMLANTVFLINIVRVLVTKLKAPSASNLERPIHRSVTPMGVAERPPCPSHRHMLDGQTDVHALRNGNGSKNHRSEICSSNRITSGNTRSVHSLNTMRKAVRATLILLPLLGLHYVVMPFRPEPEVPGEFAYQIVSAVFTSFQGLCVAFLFCFCNGEVLQILRKMFFRYIAMRNPSLNNRRLSAPSQRMTTEL